MATPSLSPTGDSAKPLIPATRTEMIAALTELGKSRQLASGDVTLIIREYITQRSVPSYGMAHAKILELHPPKPETPQADTKRDLRLEAKGIPVTPQKRTAAKFDGKTTPVCTHSTPRIGHGLSERQQLTFDRQSFYARYGRLTAGQVARLRVIEQRLAVL